MSSKLLLDEEVSVAEAIMRAIEAMGVDLAIGIPGGNTGILFDALRDHQSTIRTVLVRQESLASIMAEVYGRLTGKPAVAMGQGMFMLSNAMLGTLEAYCGSSPMLIFTDLSDGTPFSHHAPYQSGTGDYRTWDAKSVFKGVTKATFLPHGPAETVQSTQLAVKHALTGERGPVALLYHSAALRSRVGPDSVPKLYASQSYLPPPPAPADPECIKNAAQALLSAEAPVILAGNGIRISGAYSPLQELAELIAAPVATTASGKGVFPENHHLALGVFGNFGQRVANRTMAVADTIFVIGSKLSPSDTVGQNPQFLDATLQHFIQLDIEAKNASWTFPCDHVVIGDASLALQQLCQCIRELGPPSEEVLQARKAQHTNNRKEYGFFDSQEAVSEEIPLLPQRIINEIRNGLDDDAIVTCDAGENRLFMTHWFQTRQAGTLISPAATGGMGYAIPAAMGAKLAKPSSRTVAVCGDGGFPMSMNGLITCCEENIPITVIIFNNSALGWVRSGQGERRIASEFSDINYADIAESLGCRGFHIEQPGTLQTALKETAESEVPVVLDVITSKKFTFMDVSSQF